MVNWQYFPKNNPVPEQLGDVVLVFQNCEKEISSEVYNYTSNQVLGKLRVRLELLGFKIERSKKHDDKIKVPVLFGLNGKLEKYFDADGYHEEYRTVIEVEAGRAVSNYQFLKDLFQACMMTQVDYLIIAVRITYRDNPDFQNVVTFFDVLFSSGRLSLPLKGVLIIGY
jgi:hypothetical protein